MCGGKVTRLSCVSGSRCVSGSGQLASHFHISHHPCNHGILHTRRRRSSPPEREINNAVYRTTLLRTADRMVVPTEDRWREKRWNFAKVGPCRRRKGFSTVDIVALVVVKSSFLPMAPDQICMLNPISYVPKGLAQEQPAQEGRPYHGYPWYTCNMS